MMEVVPVPKLWILFVLVGASVGLVAQAPSELATPGFEEGAVGQAPAGWRAASPGGGAITTSAEGATAGEQCAVMDATESASGGRMSLNLMQSLDATPWRGKRARFSASVKTAELSEASGAQLWFRVDRSSGRQGSFDNMGDRPIRGEEWARYEVVLDIAEDAERLALGVFVLGNGKAWIDDASLAEVGQDVATTNKVVPTAKPEKDSESSPPPRPRYQPPPSVRRALATAADAPTQPFWTWWLLLPAIAIGLGLLGMSPTRRLPEPEAKACEPGLLRYFALRFTVCYWLLYCLPSPFSSILSGLAAALAGAGKNESLSFLTDWSSNVASLAGELSVWHRDFESWMSHLTARWAFAIEGELVPPNGSGDTTMGYLTIFNYFCLAFALAVIWTVLLRNVPRRDASVDLMRSFLRYVLAFAMLGYGLAKVNMDRNQFPEISAFRLDKTWGDTSPMGLVWGFMGASRPYTIFAGRGEVLAAGLLIWRHTALLGAMVAVGVMTNVLMLNYCYDVPVKIYSTHLVVMALLILMPDARRLLALLMFHKTSPDLGTPSVWGAETNTWVRWLPKAIVVGACFLWPIGSRAWDLAHYQPPAPAAEEAPATAAAGEGGAAERSGHLLVDRGFRWINEVPFNR